MKLKKNQIVIVTQLHPAYSDAYPFKEGDAMIFLGEIPNMTGGCIVVNKTGKVFWGYHTDNFRHPTEEEL